MRSRRTTRSLRCPGRARGILPNLPTSSSCPPGSAKPHDRKVRAGRQDDGGRIPHDRAVGHPRNALVDQVAPFRVHAGRAWRGGQGEGGLDVVVFRLVAADAAFRFAGADVVELALVDDRLLVGVEQDEPQGRVGGDLDIERAVLLQRNLAQDPRVGTRRWRSSSGPAAGRRSRERISTESWSYGRSELNTDTQ